MTWATPTLEKNILAEDTLYYSADKKVILFNLLTFWVVAECCWIYSNLTCCQYHVLKFDQSDVNLQLVTLTKNFAFFFLRCHLSWWLMIDETADYLLIDWSMTANKNFDYFTICWLPNLDSLVTFSQSINCNF